MRPQLDEIGVDDRAQRHLVDVDLFAQDQVQQQVERALEHGGGDRIGHRDRTLPSWVACRTVTRVLSCIQPTGDVHLGNYLGALRNWVDGQHAHDAFHGIVDLHALTVTDRPGVIGETTVELAAMLFAIGLDPDVATVFVQSHVPEHSQLAWVMECTLSVRRAVADDAVQGQVAREHEFVSAGLFTYPALQAADILLYDADEVPVGDDQRQHIEITRDVGDPLQPPLRRHVRGPEGGHAAGRGAGDGPAGPDVEDVEVVVVGHRHRLHARSDRRVLRKFKRAVTDSDGEVRYDREAKPGVSNLLDILAAATGSTTPRRPPTRYQQYGPLKADAGEAVVELLRPIQARYRRAARPIVASSPTAPHRAPARRARSPRDAAAGLRGDRFAGPLTRRRVSSRRVTSSAWVTTRSATLCGGWQAISVIDCSIEPL